VSVFKKGDASGRTKEKKKKKKKKKKKDFKKKKKFPWVMLKKEKEPRGVPLLPWSGGVRVSS